LLINDTRDKSNEQTSTHKAQIALTAASERKQEIDKHAKTVLEALHTSSSAIAETALQRRSVLAKCNWEICGHYSSIFNHCNVIGLQSYRIRQNNAK